jgi:antitoxin (DNA-binding transcriptional repressor) of toxin-antitoxin stability system
MYTVHMTVTATEFRKNLFALLEQVVRGETIEVRYKGSSVRIAPASSGSKLARAKRQPALLCDPDAIVHSDPKLLARMESAWSKDWRKI